VLLGLNDATHLSRDQDMLHIVAAGIYLGASDGVVVIGLDPRCAG
jgi:hypothetical protein